MLYAVLLLLIVACRFMPGPKCFTYCKFKQLKKKKAIQKLKNVTKFANEKFHSIDFSSFSNSQIRNLYTNTMTFDCKSFGTEEDWLIKAKSALKDEVAERFLLGINE